jgi:Tfp pilus assembly protein FimT
MIEVVIVVLILGILAAVAVPRFSRSIAVYQLDCAAVRICTDLNYAQSLARLRGTTQSVVFDIASNSYTLPDVANLNQGAGQGAGKSAAKSAGESSNQGAAQASVSAYQVILSDYPHQVTLVSADFGAGSSTATYNGYGAATSQGTIVISVGGMQRTVSLAAGSTTRVMP